MKNKGVMTILIILVVLIFGAILWYGVKDNNKEKILSLEEAKQVIESRYGGYVSTIQLVDDEYVATLVNGNNNYQVILDEDTGDTLSYSQIESNNANNGSNTNNTNNTNNSNQSQNVNQTLEEKIAKVAPGKLIVLEQVGDTTLNKYKAIVINGNEKHELDIDGNTNTITSHDIEKETKLIEPTILGKEAVQIAKQVVEGRLDDIDFTKENGVFVYEIEIETAQNQDIDIYINAETGEVIRTEKY